MQLTKTQLKQIIKEEVRKVLQESAECEELCEMHGYECGIPPSAPTGCFCGDCGRDDCSSGKCQKRTFDLPGL